MNVDVVVVGGGTSGLQAALQLARVGCEVVVLERREAGASGARWCNGVVPWQFDRAGLARPEPPELRSDRGTTHMLSPSGRHRFRIDDSPIWDADMRELVARLQRDAEAEGVEIRWGSGDVELVFADGRPVAAQTAHGEIRARLFVDASGRAGVVRKQVPALAAACPPSQAGDLCSAQQLVYEVADVDGARRFLKDHEAEAGDAVVSVGMEGGYSTINICVEPSLEEVSVLTGSIPGNGHANAAQMVARIRDEQPWIGDPIFGGGGLIPLRRVYDRFTAPGAALVGDAASQVMAGHGSGIGFGLIAGKVLAEAVASAADPGHPDVLWDYQASYLREFGAILAGYDAVRRMSVSLGTEGVEAMYASGIFSPALVKPGLEQKLGNLTAAETAEAARILATNPRLAKTVTPALLTMSLARPLYRAYPRTRSDAAFKAWSLAARAVLR